MALVENLDELAVSYAILALHDDKIPVTADNIFKLTKAADINVARYWPALFAKALEGRNIDDLISSVGGSGAVVAAAPAAGDAAGEAVEEAPAAESEKEESDGDMGMGLFGDSDEDY